MNFAENVYFCLGVENPAEKVKSVENLYFNFYDSLRQNQLKEQLKIDTPPANGLGDKPSYRKIVNVVDKTQLKPRKNLNDDDAFAALVHSIVHIEYSAIDLALESIYSGLAEPAPFGLDKDCAGYHADWLEVAYQEARHFQMLEKILYALGFFYGSFPVHDELHRASRKCRTLLQRMAVVPRYLEAMGLDANPKVAHKVAASQHRLKAQLLQALDIIYKEEIDHVAKGDRWFRYLCRQQGLSEDCFFELIQDVFTEGGKNLKNLNKEARLLAGYSTPELRRLESSGI